MDVPKMVSGGLVVFPAPRGIMGAIKKEAPPSQASKLLIGPKKLEGAHKAGIAFGPYW